MVISVMFGFSAFFFQTSYSSWQIKSAVAKAVVEELNMIVLQLQGEHGVLVCKVQGGENTLKINAVTLPSVAIKKAIESNAFDRFITRDLLLLNSFIEEHNRWADYGMDILREPSMEKAIEKIQIHSNYMAIDNQIVPKATYLRDCITQGTSPLDKDCR